VRVNRPSIAPWTLDWRSSRFEADVASEAAWLAGEVTAAIVGPPLDDDRQVIDRAEAMIDDVCLPAAVAARAPGFGVIRPGTTCSPLPAAVSASSTSSRRPREALVRATPWRAVFPRRCVVTPRTDAYESNCHRYSRCDGDHTRGRVQKIKASLS